MQEAGRDDAKKMLDIGNENVMKTLKAWDADFALKREYPFFRDYLNKIYNHLFGQN